MQPSSQVVITGANGFIGRHLTAAQLALGHSVIAIDLHINNLDDIKHDPNLTIVKGDIRNTAMLAEYMSGAEIVFNLAAAHLEVVAADSYYRRVNVDALAQILNLAEGSGIRRFVHCSTVGVYGPLQTLPADEFTPCRPEIAYESTKLAGEHLVREAGKSGRLSTVIFRPSWVFGPGCPRTLKLLRSILRKRFFFVGRADNMRHPLYVEDLIQAFEQAATYEIEAGSIFIIAGPEPISVRELVREASKALGVQYSPITVPKPLVSMGCSIIEKTFSSINREPPISSRSLKFFTESTAFSTTKAKEKMNFESETDLPTGLSLTISALKQDGLL